jgi:hypothetical protein
MHRFLILFVLFPFYSQAQKITREIEPDNQQVWLATDNANLNARVITSYNCVVHFRTAGPRIYLYVQAGGDPIGAQDYIAFYTDHDSVAARSTGTQAGISHGDVPQREYTLSAAELKRLSVGSLKRVVITSYNGFEVIDISKDADKLANYASALLKAMGQ